MPNKRTEWQAKYDSEHARRFTLKLNTGTDNDIITALDGVKASGASVAAYIKTALRAYMDKHTPDK